MPRPSSLTEDQRQRAVALFEAGCGRESVATQLGVPRTALRSLYDRWRIWGAAVLQAKPAHPGYSFEVKWAVVQGVLAGASKVTLARTYDVSSLSLIDTWVRTYRRAGVDGLQPRARGRPLDDGSAPETELERLRRENERLRAEVAYLGKLRALRATERR